MDVCAFERWSKDVRFDGTGGESLRGYVLLGEMITWMRGDDAWDASRGIGRMGIGRDGRTAFRVHSADTGSRMRRIINVVGLCEGTPDANGFGVEIPTHGVASED